MCECVKELKETLLEAAIKQFPGEAHRVNAPSDSCFFGKDLSFVKNVGFTTFTTTYNRVLKNGNFKKQTLENNILHKFCPFCGEKVK